MAANTRTFYAVQQLSFKDNAASPTSGVASFVEREFPGGWFSNAVDEVNGRWEAARGIQSVGVTTNFPVEQAFELGQIEIYGVDDRQPEVEMTLEKVIDGTKPIFFMVTDPAFGPNIVGRTATYRTDVALGIYSDTQTRATGHPKSVLTLSGMYVSSIQYTFPIDGAITESITLVGNDKLWGLLDTSISGHADAISTPATAAGSDSEIPEGIPSGAIGYLLQEVAGGTSTSTTRVIGSGVQRREEVDISRSVLPYDIPGCSGHGSDTIAAQTVGGISGQTITRFWSNTAHIVEHLQTITVSIDLGREDIFELGSKRPYAKYATFPLETTLAIEVITAEGDLIDATAGVDCDGGISANPGNRTCIIRTCEGMQIDLGDTLFLESIDLGGGGTDGGNMTATYNYKGFNTFNVTHDTWMPNHRVYVGRTPGSRFNIQ